MLDNTFAVVRFLSNAFFVVKMISIAWISHETCIDCYC